MKEIIGIKPYSSIYANTVKIEWYWTLLCNFSCAYCAEHIREGNADRRDIESAIDLIHSKLQGKKANILLSGGEPSIYPNVLEIVKKMYDLNMIVSMQTNGSRNPKLYRSLMQYLSGITVSIHFTEKYKNTLKTIDEVNSEIIKQKSEGKHKYLLVHLMLVPGYLDEANELISEFRQKKIPFICRRIRPLFNSENKPILHDKIKDRPVRVKSDDINDRGNDDWGYYTQEELLILKDLEMKSKKNNTEFWSDGNQITSIQSSANDISLRKLNKFSNWICNIGVERLHILPNGDIFRSHCKVGGSLGNVFKDFSIPTHPVVCTKRVCSCAWSINVSKAKNQKIFNLIVNNDESGLEHKLTESLI